MTKQKTDEEIIEEATEIMKNIRKSAVDWSFNRESKECMISAISLARQSEKEKWIEERGRMAELLFKHGVKNW